ncbi:MAG: hypothetical protein CL666_03480 [Balneola sp.]|nr:hypothetical protein [Balneola sp.]|tara:strand:- start:29602 stop:30315 length:714 start_codon:yes stop_codon:yes gene_type:complete
MSDKPIRDYIFPLIRAKRIANKIKEPELIGTGFLIGKNGFALTAAHVIEQLTDNKNNDDVILALFVVNGKWNAIEIAKYEKHPSEDIGIILLDNYKRESFLKIVNTSHLSACEYHCWGYPHEVAKELKKLEENAPQRPDFIFTQGYVRRRINNELYPTIIFRGKQFYELSETVGGGNSGAPLIYKLSVGKNVWEVFGIYIGEKSEGNISYAVRSDAFANWIPEILDKSIEDESKNVA